MIFFYFIMILMISAAATGLVRIYALRQSLLDIPNNRSSHQVPTPRGGGLAIVITYLFCTLLLFLKHYISSKLAVAIIGGSILIAFVGYWDDRHGLSAIWRGIAHIIAAGWALYWLGGFSIFILGTWNIYLGWLGNILAVLGMVWLINLYNFMDGIDGLAGMEGVFIALAGGFLGYLAGAFDLFYLCISLAFAIMGFLIWNWPPAKIFMGDVGSGTLGYLFAVLLIASNHQHVLSPMIWIVLSALFIFDATFTLIKRARNREPLTQAHCNHAYQYLARKWHSHSRVTISALCINVFILLPLSVLLYYRPILTAEIFLLIVSGLFFVWYSITTDKKLKKEILD